VLAPWPFCRSPDVAPACATADRHGRYVRPHVRPERHRAVWPAAKEQNPSRATPEHGSRIRDEATARGSTPRSAGIEKARTKDPGLHFYLLLIYYRQPHLSRSIPRLGCLSNSAVNCYLTPQIREESRSPAGARGSGILMAMQTELEREVLRVTLTGRANLNASVRLISQAFGITAEKRVLKLLCKKYF